MTFKFLDNWTTNILNRDIEIKSGIVQEDTTLQKMQKNRFVRNINLNLRYIMAK